RMRKPARSRYSAAACSPCLPRMSCWRIRVTSAADIAAAAAKERARDCGLWKSRSARLAAVGGYRRLAEGPGESAGPALALLWDLQVALGQFLDVDVLECDNPDVPDEPGWPVHVPDPGIMHGDLEEHLAVIGRTDLEVDIVGEIEAPFGLDHVREQ